MSRRLDGQSGILGLYDAYLTGTQPASLMSPEALEALNGALPKLAVNLARLAVLSLVERLHVVGARLDGAPEADPTFWQSWERCGFDRGSDQIHSDALTCGRAYAIVWMDEDGLDTVMTPEPATQVTTITDPATSWPVAGFKRFFDQIDPDAGAGQGHATLFLPDRVMTLETAPDAPISAGFPAWPGSWHVVESLPNPIGRVPIVRFLNGHAPMILGPEGESDLDDLQPIIDFLAKTLQDSAVSSEVGARPRRWATGLELIPKRDPETGDEVADPETGAPVFLNPFSSDATRLWQSESTDTHFGQFPSVDLTPYTGMVLTLLQLAGAVSTLPAHYLSIVSAQPPSADALRASESSLVSRALGKIRAFTPGWREVVQLEVALRTGRPWSTIQAEPLWSSPQTITPSQAGDEAAKLGQLGVPLSIVLSEVLGWTPDQLTAVRTAQMEENLAALVRGTPETPTRIP
jgi:hypothetical protein